MAARQGINIERVAIAGAIIVGGYVLLQALGFLKKAATTAGQAAQTVVQAAEFAYTSARDALSSGFYSLFGPDENFGPDTYYTVNFPDGSRHAIGADQVSANGQFTWTGYPAGSQAPQTLQIVVDSSGTKYATAPS